MTAAEARDGGALPAGRPLPPLEIAARVLLCAGVLLTLAAIFFLCLTPIAATDFWWQAKTGEVIVRRGAVPREDPFSWTAHGAPWLVHEWLTEVFFYFAMTELPNSFLVFYKCGFGAIACGLVLLRAWVRSGSVVLSIAAALAAGFAVRNYADLRPQMMTFILLAGLLLALDEYHAGRLRSLPWILPLVIILWANLHGGVVVGLGLLALWVLGEAAAHWLYGTPSPGLKQLAAGVAACLLAVAVNPNGFLVYTYPFHVLGHPQVMDYITEWWSPNFHGPAMRAFQILLIGTFGAAAAAHLADRERVVARPGEILALAAMAYSALVSQRNTAPFAIAASPVFAAGLAALWHSARPLAPVRLFGTAPVVRFAGAMVLAAGLAFQLIRWIPSVPPARWFEYGIRLDYFPRQAVQLMAQGHWPGRLYNDYTWGGYLIWKLYPKRHVFIDGRAEVYYASKTFDDEMKLHYASEGWQEALDRRGVEVVLTARRGSLARALRTHPGWKLAFTGPAEFVFVRSGVPGPVEMSR